MKSRTQILTGALIALIFLSNLFAGDLKRVAPDEAMRSVASKTKPEYSAIAKQLKLSGAVDLDVTIAEDGSVEGVAVLRGNPILAKLACDAVKQWKFTPFKTDGKAIKVISEIVVQFNYAT